jgi:acyl-CoA synthetase (NDP forming)
MRNRGSDSTKITNPASPAYKALFRPASIAVVGGSESLHKPGGRVLTNIIRHGYRGTLWVVNPGAESVSGVTSFKTIGGLPAVPEPAIIAIPAPFVLAPLEELAQIGTKAAIVFTSASARKIRRQHRCYRRYGGKSGDVGK